MKKALLSGLATTVFLLTTGYSISNFGVANAAPPAVPSAPPQDVQIRMADGLVITGTFYPSSASGPASAVLLLHQYNGNRRQWDAFTSALSEKGYNVLAVDQRGFGKTGGSMDWTLAQHDGSSLMNWLRQQPTVDPDKVAVAGASIGSNVALRVCAADPKCHAAIALSPALDYVGVTTKDAITSMHNKAVFLAASERDTNPAADGVKALTAAAPVDLTVLTKIYRIHQLHATHILLYPALIPTILV